MLFFIFIYSIAKVLRPTQEYYPSFKQDQTLLISENICQLTENIHDGEVHLTGIKMKSLNF